jgi:hypothetical protein
MRVSARTGGSVAPQTPPHAASSNVAMPPRPAVAAAPPLPAIRQQQQQANNGRNGAALPGFNVAPQQHTPPYGGAAPQYALRQVPPPPRNVGFSNAVNCGPPPTPPLPVGARLYTRRIMSDQTWHPCPCMCVV